VVPTGSMYLQVQVLFWHGTLLKAVEFTNFLYLEEYCNVSWATGGTPGDSGLGERLGGKRVIGPVAQSTTSGLSGLGGLGDTGTGKGVCHRISQLPPSRQATRCRSTFNPQTHSSPARPSLLAGRAPYSRDSLHCDRVACWASIK
jgi:hypothetical protein